MPTLVPRSWVSMVYRCSCHTLVIAWISSRASSYSEYTYGAGGLSESP